MRLYSKTHHLTSITFITQCPPACSSGRIANRWILILMLVPGLAFAGPLLDAQKKLDAMDFDGALQQASQTLIAADVQPSDLVDAYRIRGLCLSATGKKEEARAAFLRALSINPEMRLSRDTSPKLSAPFYQAKVIAQDIKPLRLHHKNPGTSGPSRNRQVDVRLEADPMSLVKSIRLCQRAENAAWQCGNKSQVSEPGVYKFQLSQAADDRQITYFFEALTSQGGVLTRGGSRDKPFGKPSKPATVTQGLPDSKTSLPSKKKDVGTTTRQAAVNADSEAGHFFTIGLSGGLLFPSPLLVGIKEPQDMWSQLNLGGIGILQAIFPGRFLSAGLRFGFSGGSASTDGESYLNTPIDFDFNNLLIEGTLLVDFGIRMFDLRLGAGVGYHSLGGGIVTDYWNQVKTDADQTARVGGVGVSLYLQVAVPLNEQFSLLLETGAFASGFRNTLEVPPLIYLITGVEFGL